METSMNKARNQHRRLYLEPIRDKESGKKTGGHRRGAGYVPFREWARANAKSFPNPSPKLAAVLRGPS